MPCCRDVLIRLIRARRLPGTRRIEVLGIDDFAVRKNAKSSTPRILGALCGLGGLPIKPSRRVRPTGIAGS